MRPIFTPPKDPVDDYFAGLLAAVDRMWMAVRRLGLAGSSTEKVCPVLHTGPSGNLNRRDCTDEFYQITLFWINSYPSPFRVVIPTFCALCVGNGPKRS